jgi:hypothetical protein
VNYSQTTTTSDTFVAQRTDVSGTTTLDVDEMIQDGASLTTRDARGHVGSLTSTTHLNTSSSQTRGGSLDTLGNVGADYANSASATVGDVSGIESTNSSTLQIDNANLTGARMIDDGESKTQISHITAHEVKESSSSSSLNVCANINDMRGVVPTPGNWTPSLPTTDIATSNSSYRATQDSVVTGATAPQEHLATSGSGHTVLEDVSHDYRLKIPGHLDDSVKQFAENVGAARQAIADGNFHSSRPPINPNYLDGSSPTSGDDEKPDNGRGT